MVVRFHRSCEEFEFGEYPTQIGAGGEVRQVVGEFLNRGTNSSADR